MTGRAEAQGGLFPLPDALEAERILEALLFAAAEPMTEAEIARRMPKGMDWAGSLRRLEARYAGRGVVLSRAGTSWAFRTAPDLAPALAEEVVEERRLSRAALETLAIVAYHQPVTRTEIEEIRGVAASRGTLDHLLDLGWIAIGPRRESPGRPATFVTTDAFLDEFGLASAKDLPGLDDLTAAGLLGPV